MKKLSHTIALIWIDDPSPSSGCTTGQIQQVRELFALHLSQRILFALVINLAALAWLARDLMASIAQTWNEGVYVLARMLFPLQFSYVPG